MAAAMAAAAKRRRGVEIGVIGVKRQKMALASYRKNGVIKAMKCNNNGGVISFNGVAMAGMREKRKAKSIGGVMAAARSEINGGGAALQQYGGIKSA